MIAVITSLPPLTMDASYCWSYAPTSRARCRGACKLPIEKGGVRLATSAPGAGDFTLTSYRCLACVTSRQLANVASKWGSVDLVPGWADMQSDDQQRIREAVEAASSAKPKKPRAAPASSAPLSSPEAPTSSPPPSASSLPTTTPPSAPDPSPLPHPPPPLPPSPSAIAPHCSSSSEPSALPVPPHLSPPQLHAFADAAKKRDFTAVQTLLAEEPGYVNAQPAGRWSALHHFAQAGNVRAVASLVRTLLRSATGVTCVVASRRGMT